MPQRVAAVIGTRPEAIKMAPVIRALWAIGLTVDVILTGQHRDWAMMGSFLESFGLRIDYELGPVGSDLLDSFVEILSGLGQLFGEIRPGLALAVGDTTTVLATALAARKSQTAFGHVEAGLRAFSRELPEEEHRICADALADLAFAPTAIARDNLRREAINGRIVLVGNPILDALLAHVPRPVAREDRSGILVTLHRQETVDDPDRLGPILAALAILAREHRIEWPVHPRARVRMEQNGLQAPDAVATLPPLGHVEFLSRLAACSLVITDSGGVQEEAAILGTPCVTVRRHTERPETIAAGVGVLSGLDVGGLLAATREVLGHWDRYARPVPELYGDGRAGEHIAASCAQFLGHPVAGTESPSAPRGTATEANPSPAPVWPSEFFER